MTIKEFSQKYEIPYNIVYQATYEVKPERNDEKVKEYNEFRLKEAVRVILDNMWYRAQQNAYRYDRYRGRLN